MNSKRSRIAVIAALVLAAAAFYALSGRGTRLPPEPAPAADQAPGFTLPAAAGGEISLSSYSGKPVMLFFFTESCPYCRAAGPAIEALGRKYGPEGLGVLGVCLDEDKEAALGFAKDLGITFPLAYDGRAAFSKYRARGVPYIYLVDAKGKIYDVWEGYDESYLPGMREAAEKLLRGK